MFPYEINKYMSFEELDEVIKLDVKCTIAKHLRKEHEKWYIAIKAILCKVIDPSIKTIHAIVFTPNPITTSSDMTVDDALAKTKTASN